MKITKLILYFFVAIVLTNIAGCKDENNDVDYKALPAPDIRFAVPEIPAAEFGQTVEIAGAVTSEVGVRDISYRLLKKTGTEYTVIGGLNYYSMSGLKKEVEFSIPVLIEDDEVAAVEVNATDVVTKTSQAIIPIGQITGIPTGGVFIFDLVEMAPEYERPVDPSQPSLFSSVGVNVNGTVKHVLTLKEAKEANSRGIDFTFINLWKNTLNNPPSAGSRVSNRGFAFCDISQLSRGPIGRQCDLEWLPVRDTTCLQLVSDNVAASANFNQLFETATDNWKTYKELNKIPELFPTWTVGTHYNILKRSGASADNTTACSDNLRNGSFIVFRRQNDKNFKYGIIKILEIADDSDALAEGGCKILGDDYTQWYTGPNIDGLSYNGVAKLYGRTVKMKIIVQK